MLSPVESSGLASGILAVGPLALEGSYRDAFQPYDFASDRHCVVPLHT